jgi:hypothetical protein
MFLEIFLASLETESGFSSFHFAIAEVAAGAPSLRVRR